MANGFLVLDEDDWEHASQEQRDWMIFKTLKNMDGRLSLIERKGWIDKGCSFCGGILGGALAYIGIKLGG